jgi:hypothetical protein
MERLRAVESAGGRRGIGLWLQCGAVWCSADCVGVLGIDDGDAKMGLGAWTLDL